MNIETLMQYNTDVAVWGLTFTLVELVFAASYGAIGGVFSWLLHSPSLKLRQTGYPAPEVSFGVHLLTVATWPFVLAFCLLLWTLAAIDLCWRAIKWPFAVFRDGLHWRKDFMYRKQRIYALNPISAGGDVYFGVVLVGPEGGRGMSMDVDAQFVKAKEDRSESRAEWHLRNLKHGDDVLAPRVEAVIELSQADDEPGQIQDMLNYLYSPPALPRPFYGHGDGSIRYEPEHKFDLPLGYETVSDPQPGEARELENGMLWRDKTTLQRRTIVYDDEVMEAPAPVREGAAPYGSPLPQRNMMIEQPVPEGAHVMAREIQVSEEYDPRRRGRVVDVARRDTYLLFDRLVVDKTAKPLKLEDFMFYKPSSKVGHCCRYCRRAFFAKESPEVSPKGDTITVYHDCVMRRDHGATRNDSYYEASQFVPAREGAAGKAIAVGNLVKDLHIELMRVANQKS